MIENNKINFLQERLEDEKIQHISIYYKGNKISELSKVVYCKFDSKILTFSIPGSKTKYVISKKEIEDIIIIPFDDTIIILVLKNDINIEIKFHKEK